MTRMGSTMIVSIFLFPLIHFPPLDSSFQTFPYVQFSSPANKARKFQNLIPRILKKNSFELSENFQLL